MNRPNGRASSLPLPLVRLVGLLSVAGILATQTHAQSGTIVRPTIESVSSELTSFNRDAIHMVDNTGLSSNLDTGDAVPTTWPTHGTQASGEMWTSGANDIQAEIDYDLGELTEITGLHLWNSNSSDNQRGVQEVDISFSTDNVTYGSTITQTFAQGPNAGTYEGETITFSQNQNARYVRFDIVSNYGDGTYSEISEVRFTAIPEPSALALSSGLVALSIVALRRRSRR